MIEQYVQNLKNWDHFSDHIVHHEVIPPIQARHVRLDPPLPDPLREALKSTGIRRLFRHQTEAITKARDGKNVLIATPTASGKTLAYNIPVLEAICKDPQSRAFYLFPIKALEQDQLKGFRELASAVAGREIRVEVYDGDTPPYQKSKIKNDPPHVIITNPDMFHAGFLPYHSNWADFFKNLKFIVVDELHTYRGVFGSHIAQVIRRINRVAEHYGGKPQYIACSATIANPKEFAAELTGLPFEVIDESGAPNPGRHFLFVNPVSSPYTETVTLIRWLLSKDLKVIAFTKSRKITELIHSWLIQQNKEIAPFVSSYRAGFLPEERREIEKNLFEGKIKAVISTSALELGIDIGGLDACILVGYPGTIINVWQRGGRAGRGQRPALNVLIAQPDALDQYFMRNPEDFFQRGFESAVLDPYNTQILEGHLPCAASELPLTPTDRFFSFDKISPVLEKLVGSGALLQGEEKDTYFSARRRPQRFVDIRSVGEGYTILEKGSDRVIGKVSGSRVFTECHPGAIYLHRAVQYQIHSLDTEFKNIRAEKTRVPFFTKPKTEKETEILEITGTKPVANFIIRKGRLKVTECVEEFEKRTINGQKLLSTHELKLPPITYETVGFWIEIEKAIEEATITNGLHFMGGIHAVEHGIISLFPLYALCDRDDIGGISTPFHEQVEKAAIFIYDGHPGGVGLCERGFDSIESLLESTLKLIASCECETGCPSCIHSPKCGSGNKPLDKEAAEEVLELLLGVKPLSTGKIQAKEPKLSKPKPKKASAAPKRRICFFDLETQRGADEVGGWKNTHLMRMSVGVVYDSMEEAFTAYQESEVEALVEKLRSADLVVGFNVVKFDYTVLQPYVVHDLKKIPTFDMLADIHKRLGYRLSLNHLAQKTLKAEKSADGLQALRWFKEGKMEEITHYCQKDVEITRDIFEFGVKEGHLLYERKGCGLVKLPLEWQVEEIIEALND